MEVNFQKNIAKDFPASIVVFLVALPLCLGIALASKAPLFSGVTAGIIGGLVVGFLSRSHTSVSGPAAGLTAVVATAITSLPSYQVFLVAVVMAGLFQVVLGIVKAGLLGEFVPNTVIKGMLAAIGIILIMKQTPHLIGYDADFEGDETFLQADGQNTFSEILYSLNYFNPGSTIIGFLSLGLLILLETTKLKATRFVKIFPAPLIVVLVGVALVFTFSNFFPALNVESSHLVNIPVSDGLAEFSGFFVGPDWSGFANPKVYSIALTLAVVASLESLLSIEATDKLDPFKRITPPNRELIAQGVGNLVSGLLGGLPVTAVIVRSSANINAGARTKFSAIFHGILLLFSVYFIPQWLNYIPLAALAGILIFTGYKLVKPSIVKETYAKGYSQFVPFIITIVAILFTDLLIGVLIGIGSGLYFLLVSNFRSAISFISDGNKHLIKFKREVSFMNKASLKRMFESIPENNYILIDASQAHFIDNDIIETVNDFIHGARYNSIFVEVKKSVSSNVTSFIEPDNSPIENIFNS